MRADLPHFFGLLPVWKPEGPTSRSALNAVQKHFRQQGFRRPKMGHAGTLDPFADGILLVLLGQATRSVPHLESLTKSYRATLRLGEQTDTLDTEGTVETTAPIPTDLDVDRAAAVLSSFVGPYEHEPPRFSAVRVAGKRLYKSARKGDTTVEVPKRTTNIIAARIINLDLPHLIFEVTCSSGTYIRSLGRDFANRLGTCGSLINLSRTAVGPFSRGNAFELDDLPAWTTATADIADHNLTRAFPYYNVRLTFPERLRLVQGQRLACTELSTSFFTECDISCAVITDDKERTTGIVKVGPSKTGPGNDLIPELMFQRERL